MTDQAHTITSIGGGDEKEGGEKGAELWEAGGGLAATG